MSADEMRLESNWVLAKVAPALMRRPKSTVYRWVEDGRVRTMRPMHELWLFIPDLRRIDKDTPRRRRKQTSEVRT